MSIECPTALDERFAALYEYTEAHAGARRIWWELLRHEADAAMPEGARAPATLLKDLEAAMQRERAAFDHMLSIRRDLKG